MMPVIDPETGNVMCWCGLVHPSVAAAAACDHQPIPYVPGAGHRPSYVSERSRYIPGATVYRPRPRGRWWRFWLSLVLVAALVAALVVGVVRA